MNLAHQNQNKPHVNRLELMWQKFKKPIIQNFPAPNKKSLNIKSYLKNIDSVYSTDAYHSLSIEGYQVEIKLIEKIKTGKWNPAANQADSQQMDVLAMRGYWQAFQMVKKSISQVLKGKNAGQVASNDYIKWYRELFSPSVTAGIMQPADLVGFRNRPVYIRQSMHTPPNYQAVRDLMPAFFKLLKKEENAAVRVVLSHFLFVYIHPFMDGNGRIGRFLMNVMLASAGYGWLVIPVEKRNPYMQSLEQASVHQNIVPFTRFLAELISS